MGAGEASWERIEKKAAADPDKHMVQVHIVQVLFRKFLGLEESAVAYIQALGIGKEQEQVDARSVAHIAFVDSE